MVRLPPVRTAALLSVLVGWVFAGMLGKPVYAQQRQPAQATQHALDELANSVAQGKITFTPTPSLTATLTPKPAPTETSVPPPTDTPVPAEPPTATPTPNLPAGDYLSNAYLRSAPEPWIELALPTGRWWVQSECSLTPWVMVDYHTEQYAYVNDCVLTTWQWQSDVPCAQNDQGVCDLAEDASYMDYLGSLPVATDTPTLPPVPTATPQPRAPVSQAAAPPPVRAEPVYIIVTATPVELDPTPLPTRTVRPLPSATPPASRTPTRTTTPTLLPTATLVPTATALPLVAAAVDPRLPPLPFDWTGVFIVLGSLCGTAAVLTVLVIRQRRRHLTQLAELDGIVE